ncbi:MAG: hypothetical protein KAU20_01070 [Nanoarchaeota archaeon]|nr:hypothetical protein [Nanoarchaeota archaeon]
MNIKNLDHLIKLSEKKELNPFRFVGIEPWLLKSMEFNDLKSFLSGFKKRIAMYHHPDRYLNKEDKDRHESYFKLVSSAIDSLLEDDFYFRKSLDELHNENIFYRHKGIIDYQEGQMNKSKEEIKGLKDIIKEKDNKISNIVNIFYNLRESESKLLDKPEAVPLIPGLRCHIRFGYLDVKENDFNYKLSNIFNSSNDPLDLELKARKLSLAKIRANHHLSKKKLKDPCKSKKHYPIFNVKVIDRIFEIIHREGTKGESIHKAEIIGSFTYFAIKNYLGLYKKNLIQPSDKGFNPSRIISRVWGEFSFDTKLGECTKKAYLRKFIPFVSNFIFPSTPLFVKKEKTLRGKSYWSYDLIVPINISNVKFDYNKVKDI